LRDRPPADAEEPPDDWRDAEMRTGATHLPLPAQRGAFPSPFDYASQARIYIVRDVNRRDLDAFAAAYRALFEAASGGSLGLFTAIRTLKAVHARIAGPLDQAGLKLYAQHVDPYDMGLLVDMFRAEEDSCLLGTDAARDGVDVPGRSLRLIVFDRVPWPRPDIIHQARRVHFGGRGYDEMLARFRLSQAFGRLIRSREDRGVFVILDTQTPTRLLTAFPPATPIIRCGLAEAVAGTAAFLNRSRTLAPAGSAD
jgi:ATP-dependent DNA helicase DinG